MGLEREKQLIDQTQSLIKWTFFHPSQKYKRMLSIVLITGIRIVFFVLSALYFPNSDGSINSMAGGVKSLFTWLQGISRLLLLIIFEKEFEKLQIDADLFWEDDSSLNDGIYKFGRILANGYIGTVVVSLCAFFSVPYFTRRPFFVCFIPEIPYAFEILWFLQAFLLLSDALIVVGVDMFFIVSCLNMIAQFRVLNKRLSSLKGKTDNLKENFKKCIEHHKFLLNYTDMTIKIYDKMLLLQYLITTFLICMVIYAIMEINDIADIFVSVVYLSAVVIQLASYCFPADEVIEEALKITFSAYSCEWYDFPIGLQKDARHIIRRAQKTLNFTAGGFISINKEAFTTIFKGAVSFYAAMKQVREKNEAPM